MLLLGSFSEFLGGKVVRHWAVMGWADRKPKSFRDEQKALAYKKAYTLWMYLYRGCTCEPLWWLQLQLWAHVLMQQHGRQPWPFWVTSLPQEWNSHRSLSVVLGQRSCRWGGDEDNAATEYLIHLHQNKLEIDHLVLIARIHAGFLRKVSNLVLFWLAEDNLQCASVDL